jgi:hypothetical protein
MNILYVLQNLHKYENARVFEHLESINERELQATENIYSWILRWRG